MRRHPTSSTPSRIFNSSEVLALFDPEKHHIGPELVDGGAKLLLRACPRRRERGRESVGVEVLASVSGGVLVVLVLVVAVVDQP